MSSFGHPWYRVYRHRGRPDDLASSLAAYVRNRGLSDNVVSLSLEKLPGREFYFVLGMVTDAPFELGAAEHAIVECPLLKEYFGDLATREEFKSFASGELRLTTLGQTIQYREMQREALDDPFANESITEEVPQHSANELLWYLSSVGKGSWAQLQRACRALGFDNEGDATRLARTFRILGHIELSRDGSEWSVNPPVAVGARTPAGTLKFLTGRRTVHETGEVTRQPLGPDRLVVEGEAEEFAAERIACSLPTVPELIAGYTEVGHVDPHNNKLFHYDLNGFSTRPFKGAPGFYKVATPSERTMHLLLDAQGTWRSGDWYSLRFFHLAINQLLIQPEYDARSWQFAVMADQRLPEAYERALVLASGLMPTSSRGWLIYPNVSPELAEAMTARLQVD